MSVFVDREYKTSLGVHFYDRLSELHELSRLLKVFKTVIVYGPRNVGKSELVRYWIRKEGVNAVVIDARLLRNRDLFERVGITYTGVEAVEKLVKDAVVGLLKNIDSIGILSIVMSITERVADILRHLRKPLYIFIDEYHLLPTYRSAHTYSKFETALDDLEALAALLAKDPRYEATNLVLTVSEGFAATSLAQQKLAGYSTAWLLVEHMDLDHFAKLYEEYSNIYGCTLSLEEIIGLVGASPGYLRELCRLDHDMVLKKIREWLWGLESVLSEVRHIIELKHKLSPREVIVEAYSLLRHGVKPLKNPLGKALGEVLTMYNIVYPKQGDEVIVFRPQLPLYEVALRLAVEEGLETMLGLDPRRVYEEAVKSGTG